MTTFLTEGWQERLAKALRKEFDRAFEVTIESAANGKVRLTVTEHDTGGPVMTVGDVASLLQMNRSVVRQMCKSRSQKGPHPIPFVKINGKAIRFDRVKIMRWLDTMPARIRAPKKRKSVRG